MGSILSSTFYNPVETTKLLLSTEGQYNFTHQSRWVVRTRALGDRRQLPVRQWKAGCPPHPVTAAVAPQPASASSSFLATSLPVSTQGWGLLPLPSCVWLLLPFAPVRQVCCPCWHFASLLLFGILLPTLQLKPPPADESQCQAGQMGHAQGSA